MTSTISRYIKIFIFLITVSSFIITSNCGIFKVFTKQKTIVTTARDVRMSSIFADHMVLQQDMSIPVWGKAAPGGYLTVDFAGESVGTTVDERGQWYVELGKTDAGGPFELQIIGKDTLKFVDVMVGEVWICSGQSNMEWQVRNSTNAQEEMDSANYPEIRMYTVQRAVADEPQEDCAADWKVCNPENVGDFSAVGYFFGRYLHRELGVPVGMLHSSWGGTPAESWTSFETLEADSMLRPIIDRHMRDLEDYPQRLADYNEQIKKIKESGELMPIYQEDVSNRGLENGWVNRHYDDSGWTDYSAPGYWENRDDMKIDGAVWFRKRVIIPAEWSGKDLILSLGAIDDFDITYYNGEQVGSTGEDTPQYWVYPRNYEIPAKRVEAGEAIIAVRIFDHYGQGGFGGPGSVMELGPKSMADSEPIELSGIWKSKIEKSLDPAAISGPGGKGLPREPRGPRHSHTPAGLYNAMLCPMAPYAIKGAIWYQGEANAGRAYQYRTLLPAMISDWRKMWNQGDFPFGIVQLANFMAVSEEPQDSPWAELREAQLLTSLKDPHVGLATIIDIGEADDIHPKNKQDVGKRLALWALANYYGHDVEYSGPLYESMEVTDGKIIISFTHVAEGLKVIGGGELKGFAIAGDDHNFVSARARIENDRVVVWSKDVEKPVAVRYAWANNPVCNLYNSAMLPAVPFRTDEIQETTFLMR